MAKTARPLDLLDTVLSDGVAEGLLHHALEDQVLEGRHLMLEGRRLLQFGSCSYLGLETDPRLKQGVIDAVLRYGTQFSASRTYVSAPGYTALEPMLEELFGAPTLVAPATTLVHLSTIPVIIEEGDAVILDQQVHHSIQLAVNQLRLQNVPVELIRHGRLDQLEEKIQELAPHARRIWFMADGVFSMYGDLVPLAALEALQARYEQLHLYLDDAHGMSWTGQHGRGYVLGNIQRRDRLVVTVSLSKAFAGGGGAVIFPDREMLRRVKTCGGPMIFTGPLQPPTIGALLASARIHLSPEIETMQRELADRVALTHRLLLEHGLPVTSASIAPIHFVGMGLPRVAYRMGRALMDEGFYTNLSTFPAVPMRAAGIRFTTTRHQHEADIVGLAEAIARHFPRVLEAEGVTPESVFETFKLPMPVAPSSPIGQEGPITITTSVAPPTGLRLEHHETIRALDAAEWNGWLGTGTISWEGLRCMEEAFSGHADERDNWRFHYYVVRGEDGEAVAATFFTDAWWKDDMLSSEAVSAAVEARRRDDPSFLTSRNLAMGCLLSEGNHLYLDRRHDWRSAMRLMLGAVAAEQERGGARGVMLRDFPVEDVELAEFLRQEGFLAVAELESLRLDVTWPDEARHRAGLSRWARKHQRKKVMPYDDHYDVEVRAHGGRPFTDAELTHLHGLYRQVHARHLDINAFALPEKLFRTLAESPSWEFVLLRLKPEYGGGEDAVAFSVNFLGRDEYVPLVCGLDYRDVERHGAYRQLQRHLIRRGQSLGAKRIGMGISATFEKTRFGAVPERRAVYYQAADHYHLELLAQIQAEVQGR